MGPRPGQRASSCSVALIMRAREPKVACSVATCKKGTGDGGVDGDVASPKSETQNKQGTAS